MTSKQKIVFVCHNLDTGGIQKALVNLLNEIKDIYDVTLFLYSYSGSYVQYLPEQVKVIKGNSLLKLLGISQKETKKFGLLLYIIRAILVLWTKVFNNNLPFRLIIASYKKLRDYDVAISYLQSPNDKFFFGGCNEFVLTKVDAKKKITFIHSDYLNYGGNTRSNKKNYFKFDKIVTVSEGCKKNFIEAIPELSYKTYCVRNCNDYLDINQRASLSPFLYDENQFNIVTVARLSEEKGITRTINIIKYLINKGYQIKWNIIGDGMRRKEIEEIISMNGLHENIILYGNQQNPYKYMVNADLFLLPSYHEAAPMVFDEAKSLGIPILTTNTISAYEMVEQCKAGWVCENSIEGITEKLEYILKNKDELLAIKQELKGRKFDNKIGLIQFYNLINEDSTYV